MASSAMTLETPPVPAFAIDLPAVLRDGSRFAINLDYKSLRRRGIDTVRVDVYPLINPVYEVNHLGFWDIPTDHFRKNKTVQWTADGLQSENGTLFPGIIKGNMRESASCMFHISLLKTSASSTEIVTTISIQAFYEYDGQLPALRDVWLPITGRCNLECVMCGRTRKDELPLMNVFFRNADVSSTIVDAVMADARSLRSMGFLGFGEPFSSNNVFNLLAKFRAVLPDYAKLGLTSNATVLTDRICAKIVESGLNFLTFSIDGASKDVYEAIRINGDFDRVIANIKRLAALKRERNSATPALKACYVIMESNYHELSDFIGLAKNLGIDEVIFWLENETGITLPKVAVEAELERATRLADSIGITVNRHACVFPEVVPDRELHRMQSQEYHRRVDTLLKQSEEFCPDGSNELPYNDGNPNNPDAGAEDLYCPYTESMLIEHSGDVNPCCSYWNENTIALPQRFGNVNQQGVSDIWNSPTYSSFRRRVIDQNWPKSCQACPARLPRSN